MQDSLRINFNKIFEDKLTNLSIEISLDNPDISQLEFLQYIQYSCAKMAYNLFEYNQEAEEYLSYIVNEAKIDHLINLNK
jgi:hypothetical protein